MKRSKEDLEKLKNDWLRDPCWDIEGTEGFEDHEEELLAFRKEQDALADAWVVKMKIDRARKVGLEDNIPLSDFIHDNFDKLWNKLNKLEKSIEQTD